MTAPTIDLSALATSADIVELRREIGELRALVEQLVALVAERDEKRIGRMADLARLFGISVSGARDLLARDPEIAACVTRSAGGHRRVDLVAVRDLLARRRGGAR